MDELIDTLEWIQELDDPNLLIIFENSYNFLQGPIDKKSLQNTADMLQRTTEMLERTFEAVGFVMTGLSTKRTLPEFEVQISSRALADVTVPKILLELSTDKESKIIETDYANLRNLYNQLKAALKSYESVRAKKAEKFLKPMKAL